MMHDFRYACRQLCASPGLTLLAVVTLALGIGANTAMFTILESVLLRPLPYAAPDRLACVGPPDSGPFGSASWLDYRDLSEQALFAEAVAASSEDLGVMQTGDGFLSLATPRVTPNLFRMLGVRPLFGRVFADKDREVVLLSEGLWRQTFHADPHVIGQTTRVNGQEWTIVGVMPRSFRFPDSMGPTVEKGLWLPLQPTTQMLTDPGYHFLRILTRLRPGVTTAQAQAELVGMAQKRGHPEAAFRTALYHDMVSGPVRTVFLALIAAVALVLLIACGNVANLLIARCLARRQEFGLRAALGAGRARLAGQTMLEGGLLSAMGCLLGFGIAGWAIAAIHKLPAGSIPRAESIELRWSIAGVLAAIASLTTLLSSVVPALLVSRSDPQSVLQGAGRGRSTKALRARVAGCLVAAELALSALLLVATGLLFRTLWNLEHTRLGFDTARLTTFSAMPADAAGFVNVKVSSSDPRQAPSVAALVYRPVLDQLRNTPGVLDAALITAAPFSGVSMQTSFRIVGRAADPRHGFEARMTAVSGGYERSMGTSVLRGRMINEADSANASYVAVVNEAFARRYFGGRNPVGERLDLGGAATGMPKPYTIVGVIGDQVDTSASQSPPPVLMLSYQQIPVASLFYPALLKTIVNFVIKTRSDLDAASLARAVFKESAPEFVLDGFRTMQQAVDESNLGARIGLYLIGAFAGLAVLMVIAGLYGVLSQIVNGRRQEIGVRLAIGATPERIMRMVLMQGSLIVAAGSVVGLILARSTSRLLSSFLFGVKALDIWTYAAVVATLFAIGGLGALVPAWRAASVNPVETLRES